MIHHNLFLMPRCCYLFTDAVIEPADLDAAMASVEVSFNRISIDGDTSTNDTVRWHPVQAARVDAANQGFSSADQARTSLKQM